MEAAASNVNLSLESSALSEAALKNFNEETLLALWSIRRTFAETKERTRQKEELRAHRLKLESLINSAHTNDEIAQIALAYISQEMSDLEPHTLEVFHARLAQRDFFKKYLTKPTSSVSSGEPRVHTQEEAVMWAASS